VNLGLIAESVILGILTGAVYALMASGLTLIFGVMEIINIAQGALVILGAYLSYVLSQNWHIDLFLGLLITMPLMFGLGVFLQWAFIRPLKRDRTMLSILVTFAIAIIIEGLLDNKFGPDLVQLNAWYVNDSFKIGGFYIAYISLFGFLLSIFLLGALYLLIYRTQFGASLRASMQNRTAAQLIGIDVERVSAITFGIGAALAAVGGMVFGANVTVNGSFNPNSHYDLISRLLVIIVLGGMGSLGGALVASFSMLVVYDVASVLLPDATLAPVAFFVLLVIVLLVRPQGLFGQLAGRKQ
jgi:branched-chain amino acid transport system permease protein